MKTFKALDQSVKIGDIAYTIDISGNLTLVLVTDKGHSHGSNVQIQIIRSYSKPQRTGQFYWQRENVIRSTYSPITEFSETLKKS
jgi:hypothetical protein